GVAGLRTTPGLIPASRIARIVARTSSSLSTWTVRSSTPASANGFTNSCGCVTIRWASSGTWVSGRIDFTMAGPIVRLGTKWPSITSMWSMSAPASAASRTWSPKRSNLADKIDGAILMAIGVRNERAWNKTSLPQGVRRREGTRYSARLGSMERREFGDDLHSANEGDRLHDVSDIATEPCFRRETRLPALIASEAHDRSFAIVRREAVDRREGHADRDRRERPRGRRHVLQLTRVEHQPDRHRHVETVPEPEGIVRCVEAPRDHRMDRRVARHVPGLVLLDREGPDVKGGLVRCLDGRTVRDIEPTAGGPSALFNWTVRTSFSSARSEARYTAYPSTVAFSITGRNSSSVEEFVSFPSRTGSKTLPRWNEPWTVTLYSEPLADATVRVNVPVRDGLPHVG